MKLVEIVIICEDEADLLISTKQDVSNVIYDYFGHGFIDVKSIKVKKEKRSNQANAYAWVLMGEIAAVIGSTTKEVYKIALDDYGVHKYFVCLPKEIIDHKKDFKFVEVMNKVTVKTPSGNIVNAVQVKGTRGSSKYDTAQMSRLIQGIISDCQTLEIETKTPEEIDSLMANYKGEE